MNTFQKLFSLDSKDIKQDVIITPFLNLDYFQRGKNNKIHKGFLFEVLNEECFSVVRTGVGASFVGDSIIYLRETRCRRIYFLGSCASVGKFNVGDLVVADKALAHESFSSLLEGDNSCSFINSKKDLLKNFLKSNGEIKTANIASLASLSLQDKILPSLKQKDIDIVDMEVSAFLSAANYCKLSSLALLYVTDTLSNKPFFRDLSSDERGIIKESRRRSISLLCDFIEKQNA